MKDQQELGRGSFCTVFLANYEVDARKVVVQKLKGESVESKRRFLKEAEMLNGINVYENICQLFLHGYSDNTYGLMWNMHGLTLVHVTAWKKSSRLQTTFFLDHNSIVCQK